MTAFFRFPHTPHLAWSGQGEPRDDKVLSSAEVRELLSSEVVIEEKLDGANLGLSLDASGKVRIQNRGQYLAQPFAGQFSRLSGWLGAHQAALMRGLDQNLIVFGEWCAARHTVPYTGLPDWFLVFDVYDRSVKRFWSTTCVEAIARRLSLSMVPILRRGRATLAQIRDLVESSSSQFSAGPVEGVVARREEGDWLIARAKLVRAQFVQGIGQHWRQRKIEWNRLAAPGLTAISV